MFITHRPFLYYSNCIENNMNDLNTMLKKLKNEGYFDKISLWINIVDNANDLSPLNWINLMCYGRITG